MSSPWKEPVRKILTHTSSSVENGWILELFKDAKTGVKTDVYLTTTKPGIFKGYHLHRIRRGRLVCLKGSAKIITYVYLGEKWVRSETLLTADTPERLFVPENIAMGFETVGEEDAWIINYPDPAYDPSEKDEQVDYTEDELERGIVK